MKRISILLFTLACSICFLGCNKDKNTASQKTDDVLVPPCESTSYFGYRDSSFILVLPTAFTPNGDGRNDLYRAGTLDTAITDFRLTLYGDSSKRMVTELKNIRESWDGTGSDDYRHIVLIHFTDPYGKTVDTCTYLYLLRTNDQEPYKGCIQYKAADISKYLFEDQFDMHTGLAPYQSTERLCP